MIWLDEKLLHIVETYCYIVYLLRSYFCVPILQVAIVALLLHTMELITNCSDA
jgi:hypothetical protein